MSFYINLGYGFTLPNRSNIEIEPDGSIILGSSMPMHQLLRRRINRRYPHMHRRLFDPQLYLAELDANQARAHCAKLASYPWFGVNGLSEYMSSQQKQNQWQKAAEELIGELWPRKAPSDNNLIRESIADCIDFQKRIGCHSIILPSPLTSDPNTSYDQELFWLDLGLESIRQSKNDLPVFATIALSDICVHYLDPLSNSLLELILDAVSARNVDGVYIVLEQGRESSETRHCSSTRALRSILHLVHTFVNDCGFRVAVNFLGQFGLACMAAGADIWASGWYKSVYRLRLADKIGEGRAFPSYWSHRAALDIHLNGDFDRLNESGVITRIADRTEASIGLLQAASGRRSSQIVPDWQYRQSNVTAAQEHFFRSCIEAAHNFNRDLLNKKIELVEGWLTQAASHAREIDSTLGLNRQTRTEHVQSWLDAFRSYRTDHNV